MDSTMNLKSVYGLRDTESCDAGGQGIRRLGGGEAVRLC